jgi:ABC-type proline/glycine betaine transport system substrate-binding protein
MEKVIRDGHVAVIISNGYGAGWSTWHYGSNRETLIFHPKLVELVENNQHNVDTISAVLNELLDKEEVEHIYLGGVESLKVQWLPEGTKFRIEEYDGAEYVISEYSLDMIA